MENVIIAFIGALGITGAAIFTGFIQLKIAQLTGKTTENTSRFEIVVDRLTAENVRLAAELEESNTQRDILKYRVAHLNDPKD